MQAQVMSIVDELPDLKVVIMYGGKPDISSTLRRMDTVSGLCGAALRQLHRAQQSGKL